MSAPEVIENKITYIKKQLEIAKKYQRYGIDDLKNDIFVKNSVERELYVIAQAVVDLSEAVVAYKDLRKPTTMRESFHILEEANILPKEFVEKFIGIVGFRNALAHDYQDLKLDVVFDVLKNKLSEVEEFTSFIKASM